MEEKFFKIHNVEYKVQLKRFDEDLDIENGASYHGFNVRITSTNINIEARFYDDEDQLSIIRGLSESDSDLTEIVRQISFELFKSKKLSLLVTGHNPPFKSI